MPGLFGRTSKLGSIWLPTDIGDCKLWLRPDLGITKDELDRISLEADQSGNGNNFPQTTDAKKLVWWANQLNGYPAIFSDGIDDEEQCINLLSLTEMSIFFVGKRLDNKAIFCYGSHGEGAVHTHQYYDLGNTLFSTDGIAVNNGIPDAVSIFNNYHCAIHCWGGGGTQSTFFLNGTEKIVSGGNMNAVPNPQRLSLASQVGYDYGSHWRADFALYNRIITGEEIILLSNYAATRYGW